MNTENKMELNNKAKEKIPQENIAQTASHIKITSILKKVLIFSTLILHIVLIAYVHSACYL